jgi:hypothetical protein
MGTKGYTVDVLRCKDNDTACGEARKRCAKARAMYPGTSHLSVYAETFGADGKPQEMQPVALIAVKNGLYKVS